VRILLCEKFDRVAVVHAEPGRGIADAASNDDAMRERENGDARASRRGRVIGAALDETRADHHVAVATLEAREQRRDLVRRVLSIAVELDGDVVTVALCVQESRLHRSTDPEIEREVDEQRAGATRDAGGVVGRAVVDDDDIRGGIAFANAADHRREGRFLVVRGNDEEDAAHDSSIAEGPENDGIGAQSAAGQRTAVSDRTP